MKVHPAADVFPMLGDDEYVALRDDIRERGQIQPCIAWTDSNDVEWLLDGRNRMRACEELGRKPDYEYFVGTETKAIDLVVSLNLRRRSLTPSQRATVAVELLPVYEKARRARMLAGKATDDPLEFFPEGTEEASARADAARATGANPHYVSDAKKLQAKAPEVFAAVKRGEKTIPQAMRATRPSREPREPDYYAAALRAVSKLTNDEWQRLKQERDQEHETEAE